MSSERGLPVLFNLGVAEDLFQGLTSRLPAEPGSMTLRAFPDGETYLRILSACEGRDVMFAAGLCRPNPTVLPLLLASGAVRDLGARRVGLVAPYLPYMRQDIAFQPGEGVTARYFARLISDHFDWLVTVDPHLHRFSTLEEIYRIPTAVAHAAPLLAQWVARNVRDPVLVGPDSESRQWVSEVAAGVQAPYLVLEKTRLGDRRVRVSVPDPDTVRNRVPVLVDDILSTGRTLVAGVEQLVKIGSPPPVCVAVHGVFADQALSALEGAGADRVVTCNTIAHTTNDVDVSDPVAAAVAGLLA